MSNQIVVDGWPLDVEGGELCVRDVDLAERAGMKLPRDIRRTIKAALRDGVVALPSGGVGAAHAPPVWSRKEAVSGNPTDVFYLSEGAALVVIMRLRTPLAVEVTKSVVRVFLAARRGELAAPAPASPAPGALETYREGVAALERARAAGALDDRGLALRQAQLLKAHLGVDILSAPSEGFAELPELPALKPGESLVVSKPVDETGLSTASAVGRAYGLPAAYVGKLARELGVFGKEGRGAWVEVLVNGKPTERKNWLYADDAVTALAPGLEAEAARRARERRGPGPKRLPGQVPLSVVPQPSPGPTGRGAA